MSEQAKSSAQYSTEFLERTTAPASGAGITVMPVPEEQPTPVKHFVTGPSGRPPTEEEALEMGRALFDVLNAERVATRADDADH